VNGDAVAHPTLVARLAEVRQEVAELLGDIDTRVKPKPDRINPAGGKLPGPVWEPVPGPDRAWEAEPRRRWLIRVVDPDESPACVFVTHPHIWDDDILPIEPDDARRIGMAFLAAADWADKVRSRAIVAPPTPTLKETPSHE
jgi:hypothetical protein